jgi:PHD/YefM family antitoxin component YafN of YafNO toxin-antitoxin module
MEIFTLKEWEENFDELFGRVENGETIGIMREDGQAAVMMPADDDLLKMYIDDNHEAP